MNLSDWSLAFFLISLSALNIATFLGNYTIYKQVQALTVLIKGFKKPEESPQRVRTPEQKFRAAQRKKAWWDKKKASEGQKPETPPREELE